eukprot:gene582-877_t
MSLTSDDGAFKKYVSRAVLRDIEEFDEAECGFCRTETDPCKHHLPPLAAHLLVVTDVPSKEWSAKLQGDSVAERVCAALATTGRGIPVAISIVQLVNAKGKKDSFRPGDVLVFRPGRPVVLATDIDCKDEARVASIVGKAAAAAPAATAAPIEEPLGVSERVLSVDAKFVFVCAHAKRDARCGYTGPVLADLATQFDPESYVGKVSHIGGHKYAGNVLVYDGTALDWFGYTTPSNLQATLNREWSHSLFSRHRGRVGFDEARLDALEAGIIAEKEKVSFLDLCGDTSFKAELAPSTCKDIEDIDEKECGFCRWEDGAASCRHDLKKLAAHVMVVTEAPAATWAPKLEGDSSEEAACALLVKAAGRAQQVKVTLVEFLDPRAAAPTVSDAAKRLGIKAGDVLLFRPEAEPAKLRGFGYGKHGWSEADAVRLIQFARTTAPVQDEADGPPATRDVPTGTLLTGNRFFLACAHTQRDPRCGYCGAVLADLAAARDEDGLVVGKVSHVGGHRFAGNALVYDEQGLDWFGFVTPKNLGAALAKEWSPALFERWRGRVGFDARALQAFETADRTPSPQVRRLFGARSCKFAAGAAIFGALGYF